MLALRAAPRRTTSTGRRSTSTRRRAPRSRARSRASSGSPACPAPASRRSPTSSRSELHALGPPHLPARRRQRPPRPQQGPRLHRRRPRREHPPRRPRWRKLMVDAGLIVLVVVHLAVPRRAADGARRWSSDGEFVEVFVDTPLDGRRAARPEGPLREGAARRAQELHRHRLALRAAGEPGDPHRHHRRRTRGGGGAAS